MTFYSNCASTLIFLVHHRNLEASVATPVGLYMVSHERVRHILWRSDICDYGDIIC